MRIGHIIHYRIIYPEGEIPTLSELAEQIPTRLGLEYFSTFQAFLHLDPKKEDAQQTCLREFYGINKIDILKRLQKAITDQYFTYKKIRLFDHYTCLIVTNSLLQNVNQEDPGQTQATEDQKITMLKLLLVANQTVEDFKINIEADKDLKIAFYKSFWPNGLTTSDHRVRADFVVHAYKGVKFVEYITGNQKFFEQFKKYLLEAEGESPMEYITKLVSLYVQSGFDKEGGFLHHAFNFEIETKIPMIAKYIQYPDNLAGYNGDDFRTLRAKPLVKIRDGRYVMTNWNFWIEKMSRGMRFDLFWGTELKEDYKQRMDTFLGEVGEDYSETFFQETFRELVVEPKDIFQRGEAGDDNNIDFYFRRHNKILLIECKDLLLVKHKDYGKIKDYIDSKLNMPNKGTGQLAAQLDKLVVNIDLYEPLSHRAKLTKHIFYPIIIVTDIGYTLGGVSQYLEDEFQKRISGKVFPFKVAPLTVIAFDFFLENFDNLLSGKLDFFDTLDYYIRTSIKRKKIAMKESSLLSYQIMMDGFNETIFKILPSQQRQEPMGSLGIRVAETLQLK